MMNNAYQSLQGIITSYTKCTAAAEKIFQLWDIEPVMNDDSKLNIINHDMKFNITIENIYF